MKVKRINRLRLRPTREQEKVLFSLCEMSAVLWNKVNYKRRQSFFAGEIDWDTRSEYEEFKRILGSATAQQVIRKNDEAWKSFLKLLRLKQKGKLPEHVRKVSPPRYWKDRLTGKRKLMTVIRNDCYRIEEVRGKKYLVFRGLRIRITGEIRWRGKQGRLEIHYDDLTGRWYALQSVEVEINQVKSNKRAYADLGVVNIITAWIEGEKQAIAFSGRQLLADWWYWTRKIARYQSRLKRVNGRNTSKRLRKMYRIRQRRFRHAINTIVFRFVRLCLSRGVGEIVVGDVSHIRNNNSKNSKINAMIHNFWSFRYIVERLVTTAENFGIKVKLVRENGTSSRCPWCHSKNVRRHKRLFECLNCGVKAHRDVVGVLNIARLHGDGFNGVLAHPLLLRVDDAPEGRSPMWVRMSVKPSEARISPL
jgi:putative transposase